MGGFLLGEFMSNTYRLDIQVNADSANTALGNLKEHFDKIEQSSGKASVGIDGFSDKADKASKSSKKAGDEAKKASNAQKGLAASLKKPQPSQRLALLLSQARWHYQSAKQMNLNQLWQVSQKSWTLKALTD